MRWAPAESVYEAAQWFRSNSLTPTGRSFLWRDEPAVWTVANAEKFWKSFVVAAVLSGGSFFERLKGQIEDQDPAVHRLVVDLLAFYYLFPSQMHAEHKIQRLNQVVAWKLGGSIPDPEYWTDVFSHGIGSTGMIYSIGIFRQLHYFLAYFRQALGGEVNLQDFTASLALANQLKDEVPESAPARNVLLHLFWPDEFERSANDDHKQKIVSTFATYADGGTIDEQIKAIRQQLTSEKGEEIDFYSPELFAIWNPPTPPGAPTPTRPVWLFQCNPKRFDLLADIGRSAESHWNVAAHRSRIKPGDVVWFRITGDESGIYAKGTITSEVYDTEVDEFGSEKVDLRYDEVVEPPLLEADLHGEVLADFKPLHGVMGTNFEVPPQVATALETLSAPRLVPVASTAPTLDQLADQLLLDGEWVARCRDLLLNKGQIILEGPPGTGKTFVAQRLAQFLAGSPDRVRLAQFHPSYSYEDFVEGYRPNVDQGVAGFQLIAGPFKELATAASSDRQHRYVLVIDELNRGNVPKIFGELYFLLEYRNQKVELLYSRQAFALPSNLLVIGTMNTADRSIALLDAALRRRFYFMRFAPSEPPVEGLLDRWLARHHADLQWVATLVDQANAIIGDPNLLIGPSHFMRDDLSDDWVRLIWQYSVTPFLEDIYFGQEEKLAAFDFDRLQAQVLETALGIDDSQPTEPPGI